jgi:hypothetical protein
MLLYEMLQVFDKIPKDSIRRWMKWEQLYDLKVYDIVNEKFIEYNDRQFSRSKEPRRYRFLWI